MTRRLARLALLLAFVLAFPLGCRAEPVPLAVPAPTSVAQAESLKSAGSSWTNQQIRVHYNHIVAGIGPADAEWKKEGVSAEERARRAFRIRHEARLTCRAMMSSREEVEDLRRRDQAKYGNPDGPTFEWLVQKAKEKGATGDAIYEGIVASAQKTDEVVNSMFGVKR